MAQVAEGGAPDARTVLDASDVRRALTRIAHEIVERNHGVEQVVLVGLQRGGVWVATALADVLRGIDAEHPVPVGTLDVSFHRDDVGLRPIVPGSVTDIPVSLDGTTVVLADDVLYTGRTVRAALEALNDYGRPRAVQLVGGQVLDRKEVLHRITTPSAVAVTRSSWLVGRFLPTKSGRIGSSRWPRSTITASCTARGRP